MDDIESIERATFAGMPPQRLEAWGDWLLGLDDGTVGRTHSTAPIRHEVPVRGAAEELASRYAAAGLQCVFRLPGTPAFDAMRRQLADQGYARAKPSLVQTASVFDMQRPAPAGVTVELAEAPAAQWEQVFLGEGFDPADGASRLQILRRARSSMFGSVRVDGSIVAVGSACLSQGWCGIHGMRTAAAYRRRGLASAILSAFAHAAAARDVVRCFLQVDERNAPALSVYRTHGFTTAWSYAYWQQPRE
jgi:GNAT superfamily N-acetyltransferase